MHVAFFNKSMCKPLTETVSEAANEQDINRHAVKAI